MKISLKKKKLKTGKHSLFIEYYKGTIIDKNGKTKHNREFEYLKKYLIIDPKIPRKANIIFYNIIFKKKKSAMNQMQITITGKLLKSI